MKKIILSFLTVAFFGLESAAQCSMAPVSFVDKISNSALVVEAKVTAKQSFWNPGHNYIYTSNLLEVYKVFKGTTISAQIEVITEGGEVGLTRQLVDPSLQLQPGETGIFVLNPSAAAAQYGKQVFTTYADIQGFFKYDLTGGGSARTPFAFYNSYENDLYPLLEQAAGQRYIVLQPNASGSQRVVNPNSVQATITSFSPTSITAGTATSLTITGVGFGATQGTSFVEFADADAGAGYIQPHATQYVSWSNTQIVVQVPTKTSGPSGTAGTGQIRVNTTGTPTLSAQTLTVNYGHLNLYFSNTITPQQIFNTQHVDLNGMGGITWQMYTGFDANAPAKAAFQRAFQSWRCATLINWALGPTVSTNSIGLDGVDVIRFDIASELPAGVLGRCTSYWSGCFTGTVVSFYVSELDICFDDAAAGFTWQYGPTNAGAGQIDFESVTLHELGHGHQLSHVINTADVMHYAIGAAQTKRVLNTDDINGANAVMARNLMGGVCGKNVMIALSPTACAAGTPTPAFNISPSTTICAGQSVTLTDVSAGTPVSWSWTLTGGAPATSTVQNPVVSYAAPGTYSITLVATNGFGSSAPFTKTISVIAPPAVNVAGTTTLCSGSTATITASGAATYTWNPGGLTGTSQMFTPAATTNYTVTGSNGICTGTKTFTLTVTATPTVAVTSSTICSGGVASLVASGATSYTWNPGGLTGPTQTFSPAGTATYTVTGANGSCTNTNTTSVAVNPNPTVNVVTAGSGTICSGTSITLTATGGTSYTWNPGSLTGTVLVFSPSSTTVYTVTGSNGSCQASKAYTVTVNPTPTIAAVSSPTMICTGQTATLTSTGSAGSYTYIPGNITVNPAPVTPTANATYTVSSVVNACTGTAVVSVSVSPCTGIENYSSAGIMSAYPNPTQAAITIAFGRSLSGKITVYNSIGQDIMSKTVNEASQTTIDLSQHAKGMYVMHITPESGKESMIRIIKD